MKKLLCIALFFALSSVYAGNADKDKSSAKVVAGKVTDAYGEAIAGAKITINETGETVFADFDGNFRLMVKMDRTYSISIHTIGYSPLKVSSTELSAFSNLSLQTLN